MVIFMSYLKTRNPRFEYDIMLQMAMELNIELILSHIMLQMAMELNIKADSKPHGTATLFTRIILVAM
jgi:hypothetical protein